MSGKRLNDQKKKVIKNMKKTRILLGVPTMGIVDYRFAMSLASLQLPENTTLMMSPRAMIDTSRNLICQRFLEDLSYTHLVMIDDDMTFEYDFVAKLLDADVDIVSGLAFKRRPDFQPCVYRQNIDDNQYYPILPDVFQEVDVVGTGGIAIKAEVFKKLKFPWFETYYDEKGQHWSVDFDFCIKAKKAGFKIFVEPSAKMGHIGDSEVVDINKFLNQTKK
jgi:hypothetical protein